MTLFYFLMSLVLAFIKVKYYLINFVISTNLILILTVKTRLLSIFACLTLIVLAFSFIIVIFYDLIPKVI